MIQAHQDSHCINLIWVVIAKLDQVIPNIVYYGFKSGKGLPERYLSDQKKAAVGLLRERLNELDCDSEMTHKEKICNLAKYAQEQLGYIFHDLMHHSDDNDDSLQFKDGSSSAEPD